MFLLFVGVFLLLVGWHNIDHKLYRRVHRFFLKFLQALPWLNFYGSDFGFNSFLIFFSLHLILFHFLCNLFCTFVYFSFFLLQIFMRMSVFVLTLLCFSLFYDTKWITFNFIFVVLFILLNPLLYLLEFHLLLPLRTGFFRVCFFFCIFILRLFFLSEDGMIPLVFLFQTKRFFGTVSHYIFTFLLQLFQFLFSLNFLFVLLTSV